MCLDWTYSDLKTLGQVSLYLRLSDLEMNRTSSLLVRSDKLVIVSHLPLFPVNTVVKPAEYEFVRHRSPIPVASRCFPLSHRLKVEPTGCRTKGLTRPSSSVIWSSSVKCMFSWSSTIRLRGDSAEMPRWRSRGSWQCSSDRWTEKRRRRSARAWVLQGMGHGAQRMKCFMWDKKMYSNLEPRVCVIWLYTLASNLCNDCAWENVACGRCICLQHYCLFSASRFHDSKHWCLWR